jgi:hypothetical protein
MEVVGTNEALSTRLFRMEPKIRYLAVNQSGIIVEMAQSPSHPSYNSRETDRIEELIVNPVVLELAARRGNLDMEGIRYVVIRYGTQYQLLMPYREGRPLGRCGEAGRPFGDRPQNYRSAEVATLNAH